MNALKDKDQELELYSVFHGKPMSRLEDRFDVSAVPCLAEEICCINYTVLAGIS